MGVKNPTTEVAGKDLILFIIACVAIIDIDISKGYFHTPWYHNNYHHYDKPKVRHNDLLLLGATVSRLFWQKRYWRWRLLNINMAQGW